MKRSTFVRKTIGHIVDNTICQTFTLRGQILTGNNDQTIKSALISWFHLSLDLGYQDRLRDYKVPEDLLHFLNTLSECWELMLLEPSVSNFKGWLRKEGRFSILFPIYEDSICFLRTKDAEALGRVFVWCTFLKKVPLRMPDLEEEMWIDWVANEKRLSQVDTPSSLLTDLNQIMISWLDKFEVTMRPSHGTGSVAEGNLSKQEKYHSLGFDKLLEIGVCPGNHERMREFFPVGTTDWSRTSRLIFVPKTYKKLRTVCPEPATLQYFQQPVMKSLYRYIYHHRYLHDRIPITNQLVNRVGAKLGSSTGAYCTIDLSAASDSVLWTNAKQIFRHTSLYKWLVITRSSSVYYPNKEQTVQVNKYAPMGSALCFPVECLIFAAVCEYVGRNSHYREEDIPHFSVYGDDIICPTSWYPAVELILNQLGFLVNKDKSFYTGSFRESCGAEYYNGTLLPHLMYKIPSGSRRSAIILSPLIDLANRASTWGFDFLRSWCIDELFKGKYIPLFSSNPQDSSTVTSLESTNFKARHRWNRDLFRVEYFTHSLSSRVEAASEEDIISLFEWLRDRPETETLDTPFVADCDLRKVRLTQRWQHPWS